MHLGQLKAKPVEELLSLAEEMGIENLARSKKQDVIFGILKSHSGKGEDIAVSYTHLTLPTRDLV